MTHARPVICSIVWAKPGRLAHSPVVPNAGMRIITARVDLVDDVPAELEAVLEHAGRVVLDDHVRLLDQLEHDLATALGGQVERQLALVRVDLEEEPAALHHVGWLANSAPAATRIPSRRLRDSTWITSAPRWARRRWPTGPATSR